MDLAAAALGIMALVTGGLVVWTVFDFLRSIGRDLW
jgi:hypothetical protein